ncbi:MAG: rhombosortase [Gammaproteobacteria bacterium]
MSTSIPPAVRPWLMLAAALLLIQAIPDASTWLRYDRAGVEQGEWWRILTANFIHLGWGHLALNAAGLLAIAWLFAEDYSLGEWIFILIVCSAVTSVGLYLLNPEIDWCVGLSGALHGLFVAGAMALAADEPRLGIGLLVGVAVKIGYEQFVGSMPFSEGAIGGSVVVDAHLWGAIGGIAAALCVRIWRSNMRRL